MPNTVEPSQTIDKRRNAQPLGRLLATTTPTLAGTGLSSAAILWAHAENFATNEQVYESQPPTVSRALTNPLVQGPFAIVMAIGAVLLFIAVAQLARGFFALLRDYPAADTKINRRLISAAIAFEIPAILGMVILSQYTGDAHSLMHDTGSYMLFFGHSFAIMACGTFIYRLMSVTGSQNDPRIAAIRRLPAHAVVVALCSFAFGLAYYTGKFAPDLFPFAQHLATALTEVAALLAFLSFLGRLCRFLLADAALRPTRRS